MNPEDLFPIGSVYRSRYTLGTYRINARDGASIGYSYKLANGDFGPSNMWTTGARFANEMERVRP